MLRITTFNRKECQTTCTNKNNLTPAGADL